MNKVNCLICDEEIVYFKESKEMKCYYCNDIFESKTICKNNHYVCDTCHSSDAYKIITNYCLNSNSINSMDMALELMKHPMIKMHGPEHHFLVPAVLLTSYANKVGENNEKRSLLKECNKRSKNVLGGFCGFYGACGAGIGCGIYMSLILDATPLSKSDWGLANLITAKALENISSFGGPRCCKRDSFVAIETAIDFTSKNLGVDLDKIENLKCGFNNINKECLSNKCKFYNTNILAKEGI